MERVSPKTTIGEGAATATRRRAAAFHPAYATGTLEASSPVDQGDDLVVTTSFRGADLAGTSSRDDVQRCRPGKGSTDRPPAVDRRQRQACKQASNGSFTVHELVAGTTTARRTGIRSRSAHTAVADRRGPRAPWRDRVRRRPGPVAPAPDKTCRSRPVASLTWAGPRRPTSRLVDQSDSSDWADNRPSRASDRPPPDPTILTEPTWRQRGRDRGPGHTGGTAPSCRLASDTSGQLGKRPAPIDVPRRPRPRRSRPADDPRPLPTLPPRRPPCHDRSPPRKDPAPARAPVPARPARPPLRTPPAPHLAATDRVPARRSSGRVVGGCLKRASSRHARRADPAPAAR
jgi:hypothetical protein